MRAKGAPEADYIPATFLKALEPRATQQLPGIFNFSFSTEKSPHIWKVYIVLPLKKA